jgi:hypothetical protein
MRARSRAHCALFVRQRSPIAGGGTGQSEAAAEAAEIEYWCDTSRRDSPRPLADVWCVLVMVLILCVHRSTDACQAGEITQRLLAAMLDEVCACRDACAHV